MTYQLSEIAKTITTGQIMNRVTVGKDEEDNSSYFNMQELVPGAISEELSIWIIHCKFDLKRGHWIIR